MFSNELVNGCSFVCVWIVPQTVFSCRGSNGVVLRSLDWSGAPFAAAVKRTRCYLHDLVMPGQKTFRKIDKQNDFSLNMSLAYRVLIQI